METKQSSEGFWGPEKTTIESASNKFPRSSVVMHKKGGDLRPEEAYGIQALWGTVFYFEPKHQVSSDTSLHFSSNATDYVVAEWNKDRWTDDEFFFITGDVNGVKVLAAARLRAVDLSFNGRVFRIYGIANVASHPDARGQGFGKIITQAVRDYSFETKITSVGFCLHKNSPFYIKCGYKIIENAITDTTWIYKDEEGRVHKNTWDEDVLWFEDSKAGFISEVLAHPDIPVILPKNYW